MAIDTTKAALIAGASTLGGFSLAFLIYFFTVKKWWGDLKQSSRKAKVKWWCGVLALFTAAQGFIGMLNEVFYTISTAGSEFRIAQFMHYSQVSIGYLFVFAFVGLVLSFLIKEKYTDSNSLANTNLTIDDKFWSMSSDEFNNSRNEALWARLYSENNGDESKAKASYLKYRANQLSSQSENLIVSENSSKEKTSGESNFRFVYTFILPFLSAVALFLILPDLMNRFNSGNMFSQIENEDKVYTFRDCTYCYFSKFSNQSGNCSSDNDYKSLYFSKGSINLNYYSRYGGGGMTSYDYMSQSSNNCTVSKGKEFKFTCKPNGTNNVISFDGSTYSHKIYMSNDSSSEYSTMWCTAN